MKHFHPGGGAASVARKNSPNNEGGGSLSFQVQQQLRPSARPCASTDTHAAPTPTRAQSQRRAGRDGTGTGASRYAMQQERRLSTGSGHFGEPVVAHLPAGGAAGWGRNG
ncbi:hypothetical protein FQA47_012272 [Oryzias melastigma]|uniref:Uncharacterized protein n=1 Tax=Oryzias melastigma TaxID=30732 RepID=A0A834CD67_ORYME|nr:hypothetical protein FQA47_012272 [Oryzias melastigma]